MTLYGGGGGWTVHSAVNPSVRPAPSRIHMRWTDSTMNDSRKGASNDSGMLSYTNREVSLPWSWIKSSDHFVFGDL